MTAHVVVKDVGEDAPTENEIISTARVILNNSRISFSTHKIVRLIHRFNRRCRYFDGRMFFQFLVSEAHLSEEQKRAALSDSATARVINYVDHTGEDASWNVDHPNRKPRGR